MTDLFWPGDHRAGDLMSGTAFLAAMAEVENAWLGVLVDAGVAPVDARCVTEPQKRLLAGCTGA